MSDYRFAQQLPADAARYLAAVRRVEQPIDLVDSIMAEVEATPQVLAMPDFRTVSRLVLAAAAVLLALAVLLRLGAQNVGPAPTPVPLDELPSAGQVQERFSIETDDVPAAVGHGFIWLTNATTGELVRMDPANGSIASPLRVTADGAKVAFALGETSVWVADARDASIVELDPASLEERRRVPATAGLSAIALDGPSLWLLDRDAVEVRRINAADGTVGPRVTIAGTALLMHDGSVWVADVGRALVRIDPESGAETGRVGIGIVAEQLLADGDSILAVAAGEPIVRVDIGAMRVAQRGVAVLAAAVDGGRVWAVVRSNYVVRLDGQTLQAEAASAVDLNSSGVMVVGGGSLWFAGSDAAGDANLLRVAPGG